MAGESGSWWAADSVGMAGTLAGLGLAAVVCGWLLSGTVDPRWTAGSPLALALGVIVMACTLLATARAIQERVQGFVERYAGMAVAPFVVFVFVLIAALCEGLKQACFCAWWLTIR